MVIYLTSHLFLISMVGYISCVANQLRHSGSSEKVSPVVQSPVFVGEDEQTVKVSGMAQSVSDQDVVEPGALCT